MAMKLDVENRRTDIGFFIPVDAVYPAWEENTRYSKPDPAKVASLKKSIKAREERLGLNRGQITPAEFTVTDKRTPKLNAGRHRWQALKELQAEDKQKRELWCVPFVPKRGMSDEATKEEAVLRSIEENAKHTPPSPMDHAVNIQTLRELGWDTPRIADFYDQSDAWVTETEKLLGLDDELQARVASGEISREDGIFLAAKIQPEHRQEVLAEALRLAAERIQKAASVVEPTPAPEPEAAPAPAPEGKTAPAPVPAPAPAPAPAPEGRKKGKKVEPVTKTRNVAKVTHTDIVKAAENKGALDPDKAPARKMTEVVRFFKELVETAPDGSFASNFAKDFLRWKDRKLRDETFENKIYEYTHTKLGTVISEGRKKK